MALSKARVASMFFQKFHECHALIAPGVEPFNPVNIIDNIVLKK
jgi:hypothetical protein